MARQSEGGKRIPRTVMATDVEWAAVRARAATAGMTITDYVLHRVAVVDDGPDVPPGVGLPDGALRRQARDAVAVGLLIRRHHERIGAAETWQGLLDEADGILEREGAVG